MTDRREGSGDEEGPVGGDDSDAGTQDSDAAAKSSDDQDEAQEASDAPEEESAEEDEADNAADGAAKSSDAAEDAADAVEESSDGEDDPDQPADDADESSGEADGGAAPANEDSDDADESNAEAGAKADDAKSSTPADDSKSADDAKGSKASRWWMVLVALIVVEFWVYGKRGEIEVCVGKQGAHDFALIGQERNDTNRWKFPRCESRENLGLRSHYDEMVEDATKVACRGATLFRQQGEGPQCVESKDGWSTQVETSFIWPWDARYYNHLLWFLD